MEDPKVLSRYVPTRTISPSLSNVTNVRFKDKLRDKGKRKVTDSYEQQLEHESRTQEDIDMFMKEEEEKRNKKVLLHLKALCVTNEARKSLWEWQLGYARAARNEKYLPAGGRMIGGKGGWASKMGRVLSGGMSTSGSISSLGRRSGFGAFDRGKASTLGQGQHATSHQYQQVS
jgi:hypothetical protein